VVEGVIALVTKLWSIVTRRAKHCSPAHCETPPVIRLVILDSVVRTAKSVRLNCHWHAQRLRDARLAPRSLDHALACMTTFTVDTHLFRELGDLLVGRDSTALVELIKNSYDADATTVRVYGESLSDPDRSFVRVVDDGVGMSRWEFEQGFLRIAARTKELGNRRSGKFLRRFTGAKGVGRLAAHKLARLLQVESISANRGTSAALLATIDWDEIECAETLSEVDKTNAVVFREEPLKGGSKTGTTITLRRLRRNWTSSSSTQFMEELQAFSPPDVLTRALPSTVVSRRLLFTEPFVRDTKKKKGVKFSVSLEGELAPPEDYWAAVANAADWIIEIDADERTKRVRYAISPTKRLLKSIPRASGGNYEIPHPAPNDGPFFQARVLVRTGQQASGKEVRAWSVRSTGIRVFVEGFRVLPYGERANDWLSLDRDYAARERGLLIRGPEDPLGPVLSSVGAAEEEGLSHLSNRSYFGAVFLTQERARHLRMLVNREGFVPDTAYATLTTLVRGGIDLCTRLRAAATEATRSKRRDDRVKTGSSEHSRGETVRSAVAKATELSQQARALTAAGRSAESLAKLTEALETVDVVAAVSDELAHEAAMLRVLASVGSQLAAFVHEINGLLHMSATVERALERVRSDPTLPARTRTSIGEIQGGAADLRRHMERQASYLIDVVSPDAARRRARLKIGERFASAVRLVERSAERRGIVISSDIPPNLKSPPMYPAELTTVFSNLLTNAVKAAGTNGRVHVSAYRDDERKAIIRIENSGAAVKLSEAERWFRPFESTTTNVDPILGQGMGLGLTITRNTLEEYGGSIQFVRPTARYATALEIQLPGA
jgi:signal transduction histidine kinase